MFGIVSQEARGHVAPASPREQQPEAEPEHRDDLVLADQPQGLVLPDRRIALMVGADHFDLGAAEIGQARGVGERQAFQFGMCSVDDLDAELDRVLGRIPRRRRVAGILTLGAISSMLLSIPACSKSTTQAPVSGTPAGNYTITITASSGSNSKTATATLSVP